MFSKMPRAAFQWIALGAVHLATARTAFEMSGRVDFDGHIKLPTNSRNGQFFTSPSSLNSSKFYTNSKWNIFLRSHTKYRQSTHLSFPCEGATSISSQFTQVLDGNNTVQLISKYVIPTFQSYSKELSTCTTTLIATRPPSTKRKPHASAKHCGKLSVFKHDFKCACHDREACFNPCKLLFSHTILPDRLPHPFGKRRKTSSSSLDGTKACFTSK